MTISTSIITTSGYLAGNIVDLGTRNTEQHRAGGSSRLVSLHQDFGKVEFRAGGVRSMLDSIYIYICIYIYQ